ncbi:MAG TPA: hypothetical protein PKI03_04875 [Pseudomonadota bacterium]|nr:hypothetical protein [Pseudomonadota bacterium]
MFPQPTTSVPSLTSRRLVYSFFLAASAVVAAPLFWGQVIGRTQDRWLHDRLPSYELYAGSHDPAHQPAIDHTALQLTTTSTLELVLRPAHQVSGRVHLFTYLLRDGQLSRWPLQFRATPSGVFRIRGQVDSFPGLQAGSGTLLFVLGKSPLPALFDSAWLFLATLGLVPNYQVKTCQVLVTPPPAPAFSSRSAAAE